MKNTLRALLGLILLSTPLAATAQFAYGAVLGGYSITAYLGLGGDVTIPASYNGYPIRAIGDHAFLFKSSVTSVTIPHSVTRIGVGAFSDCVNLATITIPGSVTNIGASAFSECGSLTAIAIPGNVTSIADYAFSGCGLTSVTIPNRAAYIGSWAFQHCYPLNSVSIPSSVTSIGDGAFYSCPNLTNVTIPESVTNIGDSTFAYCSSLQGVFFKGNAPSIGGADVFDASTNATVYYLPGTTGWGATFAGRPAVLWNPLMQTAGIGPNGFGFNITGTADIPIVIEAATNLANAAWIPLQSLNLANGAFYFSDPDWTNYPARVYRIRSP